MGRLADALKDSSFIVTGELTPPKGTDLGDLFDKAELLREQVTAFNLTESHAARMAMDPVAVGHLLIDRGIEPIVQMTARDKNRLAIQASILGAAALGISNVVFMGGDPPKNGDHPDAKPVFDLFASQLLEAASGLNQGNDLTGNRLKGSPQLTIGAVANPGANDLDTELDNMHRKADAGAEFFQTQAVYDTQAFGRFMDRAKSDKPVLAGIIPIKSVKMAQYMNDRIPGVDIPQKLIDRIDSAGDDPAQIAEVSIEIASSTVRALRSMTSGVHVMAIGWEDKIPAILDRSSA
ncbi:MAG: methylenetetrahydrofolate reductase [Pseudomonadota bacterium]|nr:methylenetetrahydrofolate reductase [Pseudomonadota bacterium]